jgi:Sulfotransferase family
MSTEKNQLINKLLVPSYIPLYHKDLPFILFWTPKSGCTTFNRWFFFQLGLLENVKQKTDGDVHRFRDFVYRKEPQYTQELNKLLQAGNKDSIKLVRNPYKRAVSSFLHTISSTWLYTYFNSDFQTGLSFKQFLTHLKEMGPAIHSIDRHIAPQYIENEEKIINHYIKLETFNTQILNLEQKYKLRKSPLAQISKSSHHFSEKMSVKGKFADIVLTSQSLNNRFPTYESFYTTETMQLVYEIFKKDFDMYGYNPKEFLP